MILVTAIGIRILITDVYLIPSSSMESTLYPNDVILVNKLHYGPILPQSIDEIPLLNIFCKTKKKTNREESKKILEQKRLKGVTSIRKGDVAVFKDLANKGFVVKRCVATAGDTFKIVNNEVYNNGVKNKLNKLIRNDYKFKIKPGFHQQLDSLNNEINPFNFDEFTDNWKQIRLNYLEAKEFRLIRGVDSLQYNINKETIKVKRFTWYKSKNWTLDNYGSIIIPKKGMEIRLTKDNIMFYKYIIRRHEKVTFKQRGNKCYVDGELVTSYTFKNDYYFMLGDNRHESHDSRYFGMVPKSKIIGKVQCVLLSNMNNKFQWNRLFKEV